MPNGFAAPITGVGVKISLTNGKALTLAHVYIQGSPCKHDGCNRFVYTPKNKKC